MHIGHRLAYLRRHRNLLQTDLCNGVVSRSHYSNIENARFDPPEDVLIRLAEKLEVTRDYLVKHKVIDVVLEGILNEFKLALQTCSEKIHFLYQQIDQNYPVIPSTYQEAYYFLLKTCYLIKSSKVKQAELFFKEDVLCLFDISQIHNLPENIQEMYYYVNGLLEFYNKNYQKSYESYVKLLGYISNPYFTANIKFNITLSLLKVGMVNVAVNYGEDALSLYLSEQKWKDSAELYNLLGIGYWEDQQLEKAEKYLRQAYDMAHDYKLVDLFPLIYHNLGLVAKSRKDYDQSLDYFHKSLKLHDKETRILTYRSILNILLEQGKNESVKEILEEAKKVCIDLSEEYHLRVIEGKIAFNNGLELEYEKHLVESTAHFEHVNIRHFLEYTEQLAEFYQNKRKYKQAMEHYKKIVDTVKEFKGAW